MSLENVTAAVREAAHRVLPIELRGSETPAWTSPHTVVAERGAVRVLAFEPRGEQRLRPIVFVYSLINRPYILDFLPGRSLLEYLTGRGFPCYVIDWGTPGLAERHKSWGDYAVGHVGAAVRVACEHEGVDRAHLYGYCMGGTLALTHAALRPERLQTFVAMATPVDFHDDGLLSRWTRPRFFDAGAVVDAFGNVPTWLMESGFRVLSPLGNVSKWRDLWENRERAEFVTTFRALERWSSDNVPFPGEVYRQYIRDTYQTNALLHGQMNVDGEQVDLSSIRMPVLAILAGNDHIVPRRSAAALLEVVGSADKAALEFPTGHIGLSTSSKAPRAYWPAIADWIEARS